MDELIDILNSDGNAIGRTALKSEAHLKGWYHSTVHVWFFTRDKKILVQQRARNKDTYPLLWDVSVAGHVGAGEKIKEAAVREVKEEIGLDITLDNLQKIDIFKASHIHSANLVDNEFHHLFICQLHVPISALVKQEGEVADLKLIPLIRFSEETWGLANISQYVPHGAEYYKMVVKAIKKANI